MAHEVIVDTNALGGHFSITRLDRTKQGQSARSEVMTIDGTTGAVAFNVPVELAQGATVGGAQIVGSQSAAIPNLTDNSGGATADGTIGAVTAPTALTDNGGGTADGTVASMAASTAPTTGTLGGTADGAFETIGATNSGDVSGAIMNNFQEVKAFQDAIVTWQGVIQNNFKELTTAQAADRAAIVALTDAIKELSTKVNAILAALRTAGTIAT